MTEPAPTPDIQVPPLPPERLAEVRALFSDGRGFLYYRVFEDRQLVVNVHPTWLG